MPSAGTARASVKSRTAVLIQVLCFSGDGLLLAVGAGKGMSHLSLSLASWMLALPAVGSVLSKVCPSPWPTTEM